MVFETDEYGRLLADLHSDTTVFDEKLHRANRARQSVQPHELQRYVGPPLGELPPDQQGNSERQLPSAAAIGSIRAA